MLSELAGASSAATPNPDRMFHDGRALRYRFIVAVMQEQAENFEIPLEELALDGLDPDRDLG